MQYVLINIRIATYGSEYDFPVQCTDDMCREKFEWMLDLNTLPVEKLDKADAELFRSGNRFETVIDSRKYVFNLPTGAMAKKAVKHKRNNLIFAYSL